MQTVAGATDPTSIAYVADLQKLAACRQRTGPVYQDSLYWVIWYLGVPAVLLGAFGLAVLARRGLNALLTWRDPRAAARVWALPLMMAVWVIVTVLWRPAGLTRSAWASRRLVPFVAPGLILGAIWASAWLKEKGGPGPAHLRGGGVLLRGVAAYPHRADHLRVRPHVRSRPDLTAQGMAFRRIGAGSSPRSAISALPSGRTHLALILDEPTADRFAQVIRGICGTPAAVLTSLTPAGVRAVVTGVEGGQRPVLLAQQAPELAGDGGPPSEVVNLLTTQEAPTLTSPPTRTWPIQYTVWMSQPAP